MIQSLTLSRWHLVSKKIKEHTLDFFDIQKNLSHKDNQHYASEK